MKKSISQQIKEGTFKILNEPYYIKKDGTPVLNSSISIQNKHLENLKSWQQFYLNRCTDGTGNKIETINRKTNQPMMVDIQISRKIPFQDWMFFSKLEGKPHSFIHNYMENGTGRYLKTSNDLFDEEMAYFTQKEIDVIYNQRNSKRN